MTEHEICKGCKWNHYPLCYGIKMEEGHYMNIENQAPTFQCGVKSLDKMVDNSLFVIDKMKELEERIKILEEL